MASNVTIPIKVTGDASDATRALNDAGSAAERMAASVEDSARKSDTAARKYGNVADSASNLEDTGDRATASLGALSSGFELVGAEKYATSLQAAAMATDFFGGVGQGASLILDKLEGTWIANAAAAGKARIATVAQTAATKAQTIAQKALNIAMRLNPIGLIITAVIALVAIFVVLYKRSDRFRAIVNKVGEVGRKAIGWIVDRVADLVGWVRDKAPRAWDKVKRVTTAYFKAVTTPYRWLYNGLKTLVQWVGRKLPAAWDTLKRAGSTYFKVVTAPYRWIFTTTQKLVNWVGEKLTDAWDKMKRGGKEALRVLTAPVRRFLEFIEDIVEAIKDIDFPDPPDWLKDLGGTLGGLLRPTSTRTTTRGPLTRTAAAPNGGNVIFQTTVNGAVDPVSTARQIESIQAAQIRRLGGRTA